MQRTLIKPRVLFKDEGGREIEEGRGEREGSGEEEGKHTSGMGNIGDTKWGVERDVRINVANIQYIHAENCQRISFQVLGERIRVGERNRINNRLDQHKNEYQRWAR